MKATNRVKSLSLNVPLKVGYNILIRYDVENKLFRKFGNIQRAIHTSDDEINSYELEAGNRHLKRFIELLIFKR